MLGDIRGIRSCTRPCHLWLCRNEQRLALGILASVVSFFLCFSVRLRAEVDLAGTRRFWSGGSLLILIFTLPETSSINILVRRAQRLRKITNNEKLKSQGEIQQANMGMMDIVQMTLVRPLKMTFTEPIVIASNLYIGFIYAVLYSWFEVFPLAFNETYGWNLGVGTLPFLSLFVGSVVGLIMYSFWNRFWYIPRYRKADGNPEPEWRLPPAMVGAFCYPICLFGQVEVTYFYVLLDR